MDGWTDSNRWISCRIDREWFSSPEDEDPPPTPDGDDDDRLFWGKLAHSVMSCWDCCVNPVTVLERLATLVVLQVGWVGLDFRCSTTLL